MATKGSEAKDQVTQKIADAFGTDFIGVYDKKIYVWAKENGQKMQIAISLTCPKTPVGTVNESNEMNFGSPTPISEAAPTTFVPAEFTQEERDTVAELMEKLGL